MFRREYHQSFAQPGFRAEGKKGNFRPFSADFTVFGAKKGKKKKTRSTLHGTRVSLVIVFSKLCPRSSFLGSVILFFFVPSFHLLGSVVPFLYPHSSFWGPGNICQDDTFAKPRIRSFCTFWSSCFLGHLFPAKIVESVTVLARL